jgi:hypothetical protein
VSGERGARTVAGRLAALIPLWVVVVAAGMVALVRYSLGPGRAADAPPIWPAASHVTRVVGQPTLVMIAHPRCACTRASIRELAVLMAHSMGKVSTTVLFVRPSGTSSEWNDTDLRRSAESIPGVTVLTDPDGQEAARFGAATSGQVLLYDARGRLRFSGGITAGRGHEGDNPGRLGLQAYLVDGQTQRPTTPVFGCELFQKGPATAQGAKRTWQN